MIPTAELFKFVKARYDTTLVEDPFWSNIANTLYAPASVGGLYNFLLIHYPKLARNEPRLIALTDPLFFGIISTLAANARNHEERLNFLEKMFAAWTQNGTRVMPNGEVEFLIPPLKTLFHSGASERYGVANILHKNEILWPHFEMDILSILEHSTTPRIQLGALRSCIHRYAPHRADLYDTSRVDSMYMDLCGTESVGASPLSRMVPIFKGPHNNAAAWSAALKRCAPYDETLPGQWLQMLPTFNALRLDPQNADAWKFWHLLRDSVKNDSSGQELMTVLTKRQPVMHESFSNTWNAVDTLYEGNTRYKHAAHIYTDTITLAPTLIIPNDLYLTQ